MELLLTFAIPQKDVQPLARSLLQRFGSLRATVAAPEDELKQVSGVGDGTVALLKLAGFVGNAVVSDDGDGGASTNRQLPLFASPDDPSVESSSGRSRVDDEPDAGGDDRDDQIERPKKAPRRSRHRGSDLFGKALLKDAIDLLPRLPDTESLDEMRAFLRRGGLHYNSEQTRIRYSNYILLRMFPTGSADAALRTFARRYPNSRALRDVAFYRFAKAEPLMARIVRELLAPAIGPGVLPREVIRHYLAERFPEAKAESIQTCYQASIEALEAARLCRIDRKQIVFHLREIDLTSFAFVLHSEFPEPGMYPLSAVESNPAVQAMLWREDRLIPTMYELRNRGLISKISEIDTVRQFTTRYDLDELVGALESGGGIE